MLYLFFFNDTATTEIYTLSLHDALPISHERFPGRRPKPGVSDDRFPAPAGRANFRRLLKLAISQLGGAHSLKSAAAGRARSEEHTSELQSPCNLVCRLLLEKKKKALFSYLTSYSYHANHSVPACVTHDRTH